jgi:hypothetical protein
LQAATSQLLQAQVAVVVAHKTVVLRLVKTVVRVVAVVAVVLQAIRVLLEQVQPIRVLLAVQVTAQPLIVQVVAVVVLAQQAQTAHFCN